MILEPLGFSRVEVESLGLQESRPQQQLPKAPDNPAACTHPSHPWAASQALTKSSKGHTLSLQPPSLGPWGAGEVWAKAVGVSGRKRTEALRWPQWEMGALQDAPHTLAP